VEFRVINYTVFFVPNDTKNKLKRSSVAALNYDLAPQAQFPTQVGCRNACGVIVLLLLQLLLLLQTT